MKLEGLGLAAVVCFAIGGVFSILAAVLTAVDQANTARDLSKKSDKISRLTRINADLVTGGDSYCFLHLNPTDGDNANISAVQHGDYAVTGISVTWLNFTDSHNPMQEPNNHCTYAIPSIGVGASIHVASIPLSASGATHFIANINARNGSLTETITGKRTQGIWKFALQVQRFDAATHQIVLVHEE